MLDYGFGRGSLRDIESETVVLGIPQKCKDTRQMRTPFLLTQSQSEQEDRVEKIQAFDFVRDQLAIVPLNQRVLVQVEAIARCVRVPLSDLFLWIVGGSDYRADLEVAGHAAPSAFAYDLDLYVSSAEVNERLGAP